MSRFDFLTPDFIKKHCKPVGIQLRLDVFPWKYLGWSAEEFMAELLRFPHGQLIQEPYKWHLLGVVRIEEQRLLEIHKFVTDRERVMGPAPKYTQLELFK